MKKFLLGVITIIVSGLFTGCNKDKELPYNAVILSNGTITINESTSNEYFTKSFLEQNMTFGAKYRNPDWDSEDEENREYLYDETSPAFRTHIIKEQRELDLVFNNPPQVSFDEEMIIVYIFTAINARQQILKDLRLEDNTFKIEFTTKEAKSGYKDTSMPMRRFIVIKMEKLDITNVSFENIKN